MISKKIYWLLRRLFHMTQENKLEWGETGREGVYQIAVDEYTIRIAEERGEDPKSPPRYVLSICNAKGAVLEQITGGDMTEHLHNSGEYLGDLYQRARRIAMGVETALDRIIKQLGDEKPPEEF